VDRLEASGVKHCSKGPFGPNSVPFFVGPETEHSSLIGQVFRQFRGNELILLVNSPLLTLKLNASSSPCLVLYCLRRCYCRWRTAWYRAL